LVVTSIDIVLCLERSLQLYSFRGVKVREWFLEASIRYIKVVGGPSGREGLLIGLKNGQVFKVFLDNQFPILLIKHSQSIRCLDLSRCRTKLALVDEEAKLHVYDCNTKELLFSEENANSVAWNTEMDEMLCWTGGGEICIRTGSYPVSRDVKQGFVVGFKGSKAFCLQYVSMETVDISQSISMFRYAEENKFEKAYQIACMGVTDNDWRQLAMKALEGLNFAVARRAFIRIRDAKYTDLVNRIEMARKCNKHDDQIFLGDILAYEGKFNEAAKTYCKTGHRRKAIEMYLDLRNWELAKKLVEEMDEKERSGEDTVNMIELLQRQAKWLLNLNETQAAAEVFWAAGDYAKAISIVDDTMQSMAGLMAKIRALKNTDPALGKAAQYFKEHGHHQFAKETYLKMGDFKSLMELHIECHKWEEAFTLLKTQKGLSSDIYLPYAEWLAVHDRFDEASEAFRQANRAEEAHSLLRQLTENSITENRFGDAAYYTWLLASECARNPPNAKEMAAECLKLEPTSMTEDQPFKLLMRRAELYSAYSIVHEFITSRFTIRLEETIFYAAMTVLSILGDDLPPVGISRVNCLFVMGNLGISLGAYRHARTMFQKLLTLRVPKSWWDIIDTACLKIRTKPYCDKEDLALVCYRCGTTNLMSANNCANCNEEFIRGFCSFDCLPLVEFYIDPAIDPERAETLIKTTPRTILSTNEWEGESGNVQSMTLDDQADGDEEREFNIQLMSVDGEGGFRDIVANETMLTGMNPAHVFIRKFGSSVKTRYFKTVMPDIPLAQCPNCCKIFYEDDFDLAVLKFNGCPFCRFKEPTSWSKDSVAEGGEAGISPSK